jgi:hypothetical protein
MVGEPGARGIRMRIRRVRRKGGEGEIWSLMLMGRWMGKVMGGEGGGIGMEGEGMEGVRGGTRRVGRSRVGRLLDRWVRRKYWF